MKVYVNSIKLERGVREKRSTLHWKPNRRTEAGKGVEPDTP